MRGLKTGLKQIVVVLQQEAIRLTTDKPFASRHLLTILASSLSSGNYLIQSIVKTISNENHLRPWMLSSHLSKNSLACVKTLTVICTLLFCKVSKPSFPKIAAALQSPSRTLSNRPVTPTISLLSTFAISGSASTSSVTGFGDTQRQMGILYKNIKIISILWNCNSGTDLNLYQLLSVK